jgi:hypothetical protein
MLARGGCGSRREQRDAIVMCRGGHAEVEMKTCSIRRVHNCAAGQTLGAVMNVGADQEREALPTSRG